jgi:hypothetical protein
MVAKDTEQMGNQPEKANDFNDHEVVIGNLFRQTHMSGKPSERGPVFTALIQRVPPLATTLGEDRRPIKGGNEYRVVSPCDTEVRGTVQ